MKNIYYDTHCHLNMIEDKKELKETINQLKINNLKAICVGTDLNNSKIAIEISNQNKNIIYASVGVHPNDVDSYFEEKNIIFSELKELIKNNKNVVAIGETGLDYFRTQSKKENQKEFLIEHIKLSIEFNLPLILHVRNAEEDIIEILKEYKLKKVLIHCFSSNWFYAKKFIALGCIISFSGIITFPKNIELHEVIKQISFDKIFVETDSPWLAPIPFRGKKNIPSYVIYTYKKISEIKNIEINELKKIISTNINNFFKFIDN